MKSSFWSILFHKKTEQEKEVKYIKKRIVKVDKNVLLPEDIFNYSEQRVFDYFNDNQNLLMNIVLPMYKLAIDNSYLDTESFIVLLKEAFVLDNKNDDLTNKLHNIHLISAKYHKALCKNIIPNLPDAYPMEKPLSNRIRSRAAEYLKNLYIDRIYFIMGNDEKWAESSLHGIKSYYSDYFSKKIVFNFIKHTYMLTFTRMIVYDKLVKEINSNKQSDYYKIINNAINKFSNQDEAAEKTYDIFIDTFKINRDEFSLNGYKQFISFMVYAYKEYSLYGNNIIEKLNLDDLSKSKILQYNSKQLAKSIVYYNMSKQTDLIHYFKEYEQLDSLLKVITEQQSKEDLLYNNYTEENKITIDDIDLMSGIEFENYIKQLLEKKNYKCSTTKTTGDQGVDLIAEKDNVKIAIQAKCYSGSVGNHAIMEAFAGMKYYNANRCMVITNSYFTKSAIELAKSNNVVLWNRDTLIEKMYE